MKTVAEVSSGNNKRIKHSFFNPNFFIYTNLVLLYEKHQANIK